MIRSKVKKQSLKKDHINGNKIKRMRNHSEVIIKKMKGGLQYCSSVLSNRSLEL